MRKGTIEMRFSSSNEVTNKSSTYNTSSFHTDVEWLENPFRNLQPKIYFRQRNASSKMIIDEHKKLKTDLTSFRETNHQATVRLPNSSSPIRTNDNFTSGLGTRGKILQKRSKGDGLYDVVGKFNRRTYSNGQDKIVYIMNQRNISLSRDNASEGTDIQFPLILTPRKHSRESSESENSSFIPSCGSRQDVLPRIRYGSFVSMTYQEEKKNGRRGRKKLRDSQVTSCGPKNQSSLNATSAYLPCATTRDLHQTENHITLQQTYTSVAYDKRPKFKTDERTTKDIKDEIDDVNVRKNTDNANSCKNRIESNFHGTNSDIMILKAKLHRSSFI